MNNFYDLNGIKKENISTNYFKRNNKPKLVFLFNVPTCDGVGVFKIVAYEWGNKAYYHCVNHIKEERKKFGWKIAIMELPK